MKRNRYKKVCSRICLCGKLNYQKIVKSNHQNKWVKCKLCLEHTYFSSQALFCIDLELEQKSEFERFAIAWG
jgi:hypothetical protein